MSNDMHNDISTEIDIKINGLRVGHEQDDIGKSGLTVFIFDRTTVASICFAGIATSTRQVDGLNPDHIVPGIDAILFTGGSAYGLDATGGVLRYLEEQDRGLPTKYGRVPIVPAAAIFDLAFGDFKCRPDAQMANQACKSASSKACSLGSVGVGIGASVGKLGGIDKAMKGGFGSAYATEGDLRIQVFVALNSFGDVLDLSGSNIVAGARKSHDSLKLLNSQKAIDQGEFQRGFIKESNQNTVLLAVCTNAKFTKQECSEAAKLVVKGLKQSFSSALAPVDGDLIILSANGSVNADVKNVGSLAASLVGKACLSALDAADGFSVLPVAKDVEPLKI